MSENYHRDFEEINKLRIEIENKIQFLENNFENLTEQQLEDLINYSNILNEKLHPEIEDIKNEMEKNKNEIIRKGQSHYKNDLNSDQQ